MKRSFTQISIITIICFVFIGCFSQPASQSTPDLLEVPEVEQTTVTPAVEEVREITCNNGLTYREDTPEGSAPIIPEKVEAGNLFTVELHDNRVINFTVPQEDPPYFLYYKLSDYYESLNLSKAEDERCLEVGDVGAPHFLTWDHNGSLQDWHYHQEFDVTLHPPKGQDPTSILIGNYEWLELIKDTYGGGQTQYYFADVNNTPEQTNDDLRFSIVGREGCGLTVEHNMTCEQDQLIHSILESVSIKKP